MTYLLVQHLGLVVLPGVPVELCEVVLARGDVGIPGIEPRLWGNSEGSGNTG